MKELHFKQKHPQFGDVNGIMRIIGEIVYVKFSNNQYSQQAITALSQKGAKITLGRGWVKVEMFHNQTLVKLGGEEFDVKDKTDVEMESILGKFFKEQYTKAGMEVSEK